MTRIILTSSTNATVKIYTYEELFQATALARFGMRAQRRAEGKWKRTGSTEIFVQMEQEVNK